MKAFICLLALTFAFSGCSRKSQPVPDRPTADDLLNHDKFWTLVYADFFMDGGSRTLSFRDSDGNVIHLWAQAPLGAARRTFYLKRSYNDPDAIEILPGSPVEQRVLELLATYHHGNETNIPDSDVQHFAAVLRDRTQRFPAEK